MVIGNVDILALLSTYQGRINRAKYWIAILCYLVIGAALAVLGFVLGMLGSLGGYLMILIAVVAYIAMIVSGIFVGIKRLHDRGKSGWWLLVFMLAPGSCRQSASRSADFSSPSARSPRSASRSGCLSNSAVSPAHRGRTSTDPIRWRELRRHGITGFLSPGA